MLLHFVLDNLGKIADRFQIDDLSCTAPGLESWIESDAGIYLLGAENRVLKKEYANLPGYHLLHLGLSPDSEPLDFFSHLHRFSLYPRLTEGPAAVSAYGELPLPSEIIDLAVVQHALEFSAQPKTVLAEVSRVIIPGGHLILCILNPLGPLGLRKLPMQLFTNLPHFRFHLIRRRRLHDWLSLLGFQVSGAHYGAYHMPRRTRGRRENESRWDAMCESMGLPFGSFYIVHAVKRVARGIIQPRPRLQIAVDNGFTPAAGRLSSPARLRDVSRVAR